MNFHVLTVFPEMILSATSYGVIGQARANGLIAVSASSPREFTTNVHQTIDDRPFGGGDGMIMMAEPMSQAIESLRPRLGSGAKVIHLSPRGKVFTDSLARELTSATDLVFVASRYGGIDQRFLNRYVDEEISIGDYVLSGGEFAALVVIDAVARLLPGVVGNQLSPQDESFAHGSRRLEYPQFTRPRDWGGVEVPAELLTGHHQKIEKFKRALSTLVTMDRRPDLFALGFDRAEIDQARKAWLRMTALEREACGLSVGLGEKLESYLDREGQQKS